MLPGRAGAWNIGVLAVATDASGARSRSNRAVVRLSRNLGALSTIGGIFTTGDPTGAEHNRLYGLDYNYRTSGFLGGKNLTASAFALRTESGGAEGDDLAYGASIAFPNDRWSGQLSWKEIGEDFRPALGFVPRTGIRSAFGQVGFEPRLNTSIRKLTFNAEARVITDTDDRVETIDAELRLLGIEWETGDELRLEIKPQYERLDADFEIQPEITIPAGEYDFLRYRLEVESALKRPVSGQVAFEFGEFLDGERTDAAAEVSWRPSRFFTGALGYEQNRVDLPAGAFTTHLGKVRGNWSFTPDLDWLNFVQFDNESDSIGWQSRLRWIVNPGEEVYLVWSQVEERDGDSLVPLVQRAEIKISYTLRF
jgi:hypothetical protein